MEKVTITDIAYGGKGLAVLEDGKVCFIPFSAIGDELEIEIVKSSSRFSEGKILKILKKSSHRVEPKCEEFEQCGGCQYQHIDYKYEVESKSQQLISLIQRIGGIKDFKYLDLIVGAKSPYSYRNKMTLTPFKTNNDTIDYGLYSLDNRTLIPVKKCPIVNDGVNESLAKICKTPWAKKNALKDKPSRAVIRSDFSGDSVIFYGKAPKKYTWLNEVVAGHTFKVPLGGFFQVNIEIASQLLSTVSKWIQNINITSVIDLYCGVGLLSASLKEKKGFGCDTDEEVIEVANHNARELKGNFKYLKATAEKGYKLSLKRIKNKNHILIVDPPRQGLSEKIIELLNQNKPQYIVYVSCNASTLSRDLKKLSGNFKIKKSALFDMFPQTAHFETSLLLELK